MARNGSGTYSLPVNSWNPAVNAVSATAADWQSLIDDIETALTGSLAADGQTAMTGNLAMGGFKLTGLAAGTAAGNSIRYEQVFGTSGLTTLAASGGSALSGFLQSGTGATARTVQTKLRDVVSVTDFGALFDGTTDDVAAFRLAHDALPSNGGTIYMPAGTTVIGSAFVITKKVKLIGQGCSEINGTAGATTIKKPAAATGNTITVSANNVLLEGFTIQGVAGNAGDGIGVAAGRCSIEDVAVFLMGNDGVRIGTDAGVNANLWYLKNLRVKSNVRDGLRLSDKVYPTAPDANGGTCVNIDAQSNGGAGVYSSQADLNTFIGGSVQTNGANGFEFAGYSRYNQIFGTDAAEGNTGYDLTFGANTTNNSTFGKVFTTYLDSGSNNTYFQTSMTVGNVNNTDVKSLDWYEEGSWTPVITFSTPGDLSVTYAASGQVGRYQRIGNRVTVSFTVSTSAFTHTTASGGLRITGLPWASTSGTNLFNLGAIQYAGITAATTPHITCRSDPSTSYLGFIGSGSGVANVSLSTVHAPTGASIVLIGTISYQVQP